jgi:hypothetical protein
METWRNKNLPVEGNHRGSRYGGRNAFSPMSNPLSA